MPLLKIAPITFPHTFYADNTYRIGLGMFTVVGIAGAASVMQHEQHAAILLWALTGLYLLLLALVLSLRIRVDGEGLTQRWLFSGTRTTWKQIARLERTRRAWSLLDANGKEVALLSFLSRSAQDAIAQEAIQRARLRKCTVAPKPPLLEQWERKK